MLPPRLRRQPGIIRIDSGGLFAARMAQTQFRGIPTVDSAVIP